VVPCVANVGPRPHPYSDTTTVGSLSKSGSMPSLVTRSGMAAFEKLSALHGNTVALPHVRLGRGSTQAGIRKAYSFLTRGWLTQGVGVAAATIISRTHIIGATTCPSCGFGGIGKASLDWEDLLWILLLHFPRRCRRCRLRFRDWFWRAY
jgi:hypothetical protein